MYSVIYYPYTTICDQGLLKTALLLWDHLEFIMPYEGYDLKSFDNNMEIDAALELIGKCLCPSDEQRQQAHTAIEEIATSQLAACVSKIFETCMIFNSNIEYIRHYEQTL